MRWILYNALFTTLFLAALPYYLYRMWRRGGYRRGFLQRLGIYDAALRARLDEAPGRIWVHAVSVGELFVAFGLMDALRAQRTDVRFLLTVNTSTARRIAEERCAGSRDLLLYFPVDLPGIQRRLLRRMRPEALLLVDGEYWPNLIREAARQGVPVGLVNGRLSPSSHRGYRAFRFFARPVVRLIDCACMQGEGDRARLIDLGADPARVHTCGSAKYDTAATDDTAAAEYRAVLRRAGIPDDAILLLGGSTWPGEEAALLDLYRNLKPDVPRLVLALAPRHVERLPQIEEEIRARGLAAMRRSAARPGVTPPDVFLLDTTGELRRFYAAADAIFIGKSLTAEGGQNPIEAAAWSKPVLCGPNMQNFPVIMEEFLAAQAILQVMDRPALEKAVRELLLDSGRRDAYARRAGELVQRRRGALQRSMDRLEAAGLPLRERSG